jgi:hypothetical protein
LKKGDLEKVRNIDLEGRAFSGDAEIIFHEEILHRFLFIGTETRLWMAWMEFLSNYEFVSLIVEIAKLQHEMKVSGFTFLSD